MNDVRLLYKRETGRGVEGSAREWLRLVNTSVFRSGGKWVISVDDDTGARLARLSEAFYGDVVVGFAEADQLCEISPDYVEWLENIVREKLIKST